MAVVSNCAVIVTTWARWGDAVCCNASCPGNRKTERGRTQECCVDVDR
jgi:hypothetical protein